MTRNPDHRDPLEALYAHITGEEDARVCKDIPESACRHQPRNFFAYLGANLLGKVADELASARLVLPWLFGALGIPQAYTGFLVPIREAGVLVPQLVVAAVIRRLPVRKGVWILGTLLTALALAAMGAAAWFLEGHAAGAALLLAGGLVGVLGDRYGASTVVLLLALISLLTAVQALRLPEVSEPG